MICLLAIMRALLNMSIPGRLLISHLLQSVPYAASEAKNLGHEIGNCFILVPPTE